MFKTIDLDINYKKLLKEYYDLNIDNLLYNNHGLKQLSLHCRKDTPNDQQLSEGCGSLLYDWVAYEKNPIGDVPLRKPKLKEWEFDTLCDMFKNTYFEVLVNEIKKQYNVLRGRFMLSEHKTCLTMHTDMSPRLHVPIYTNENCMMIVDDNVIRLPFGATYIVDTRIPHTQLNASKDPRVHLIFAVDRFE